MSKAGEHYSLKRLNADYELWHNDNSDLDYVVFSESGLKKIAQFYNEKYGVVIAVSDQSVAAANGVLISGDRL